MLYRKILFGLASLVALHVPDVLAGTCDDGTNTISIQEQYLHDRLLPNRAGRSAGVTCKYLDTPYDVGAGLAAHAGIDFGSAPRGEPVFFPWAGTVVVADTSRGPFGVELPNGWRVFLGHLDSISLSSGSIPAGGAYIGTVGDKGLALGVHLHVEVRVNTTETRMMGGAVCGGVCSRQQIADRTLDPVRLNDLLLPQFHGAGSVINPGSIQTKVCDSFGGWGCYRDEVRVHADRSVPLGVFQVGRDSNHCTQVNVRLEAVAGASVPLQNVKVRVGPWDLRSADVEYTVSLPATVPLTGATWNLLAVQFPNIVDQPLKLLATCASNGGAQHPVAASPRAPSNSVGVPLADSYIWTGNGSVISRSGGSVGLPFGSTQDWARMYSYSGNGTGGTFFQWQKSATCSRVALSALTDSGHYRVRIRSWSAAPSAAFSQDAVFLNATTAWSPSAALTPVDDYYLIEVRPQPSSINSGMHNLQLKCM